MCEYIMVLIGVDVFIGSGVGLLWKKLLDNLKV